MICRNIVSWAFLTCVTGVIKAQPGPQLSKTSPAKSNGSSLVLPAYRPSREEILVRYKKAAVMDSISRNKVFKTTIQPTWQADGQGFWYRNSLKDTVLEYYYVDAVKGTKQKAFDHSKLSQSLAKAVGKAIDASRLRLSNLSFENNGNEVTFQTDNKWYKANLGTYEVVPVNSPTGYRDANENEGRRGQGGGGRAFANNPYVVGPVARRARAFRGDSLSPDKMWVAYARSGNIYVRSASGTDSTQFTTDGTREKPYGNITWSPDSKNFVAYHINPVVDKQVSYILTSASGTRGEVKSRGYAQPGDENTSYEMFVFNFGSKKQTKVDIDKIDFSGVPYLNWRADDSKYFTFERVDRGHQRFRIIEVNTETAKAREIVDEKTKTFIYEQRIFTHFMPETHEILWVTEKDGWRHIYLLDELTGKEKNQVTKGDWVVREIDSIDKKKRKFGLRQAV